MTKMYGTNQESKEDFCSKLDKAAQILKAQERGQEIDDYLWQLEMDRRARRTEYSSKRSKLQKELYVIKSWVKDVRIRFTPRFSLFSIYTPRSFRKHRKTIMALYSKFGKEGGYDDSSI